MKRPTQKDMAIIGALDRIGPKISTEELSEILNIPARTVRYRIKKLKEVGVLQSTRAMVLERKLGLGECIFIVNAKADGYKYLPDIFYTVDTIYHYSSTYGQYNGYLAYGLYSLATPDITRNILEECMEKDLISGYVIIDVADYDVKQADYTKYDPKDGWNWDWDQWEEQIRKNFRYNRTIQPPLKESQTIVGFDFKDVSLLRHLFDDGEITKKKLAKKLSLSETQVKRRLQRLEKEGIIKGYRSPIRGEEESVPLFCFFEVDSLKSPVLASIYELPFPATIILESSTRYAMTMSLSTRDLKGFLKGFDILRPHLVSYFIQTIHNSKQSMDSHPYDLYNQETNGWITPEDDYMQDIQDVLSGKKTKKKTTK